MLKVALNTIKPTKLLESEGHVRYCHLLASVIVVCKLLHFNLLWNHWVKLEPEFHWVVLLKSFLFLLIGCTQKKPISVKKGVVCFYLSLKTMGQLESNLVVLFIGWFYEKLVLCLLIGSTWKKREAQKYQKWCCVF
jgi:hypothetical protein